MALNNKIPVFIHRVNNEVAKNRFFKRIDKVNKILIPLSNGHIEFYLNSQSYKAIELPEIANEFYDVPNEVKEIKGLDKYIERINELKSHTAIAHRDFVSVNIILDREHFGVVDWQWLARGYPPLFDIFSLISSLFYWPEYRRAKKLKYKFFATLILPRIL